VAGRPRGGCARTGGRDNSRSLRSKGDAVPRIKQHSDTGGSNARVSEEDRVRHLALVHGLPRLAEGQGTYLTNCAGCHGANGEGNIVLNAPKLAGQESWYLKRQLNYYKQGIRGTHTDDLFGQQMAPMAATLADDAAINNVVAYIQTLPNDPAPVTIQGNVANGQALFNPTCGICHNRNGQGVWAVNAPALSGFSDWYLVRQLQNYKSGVRGAHPQDKFGFQMTSMVNGLKDDEAITDVVAYINSLR